MAATPNGRTLKADAVRHPSVTYPIVWEPCATTLARASSCGRRTRWCSPSVLTALTVSSTAAYIFVLILVAIPILYWIILALTGRLGRRR